MKKISYIYYVLILLSVYKSFSLDIPDTTTIVRTVQCCESGISLLKNIYCIVNKNNSISKELCKNCFVNLLKKKVFHLCGLGLLLISLKYQEKKVKKIISSLEKYCTEGVARPVVFSFIFISGVSLMDIITKKTIEQERTFLQYWLINVAIFYSVVIFLKLGFRIETVVLLVFVMRFCCKCYFGMDKCDFTMLEILLYCREVSNILNGFEAYLSFFLRMLLPLNTFKYFTYEMKEALLKEVSE